MRYSAFLIAFLTIIVRYYDYALFGLGAANLAETFMPSSRSDQQILSFFAIFSVVVIVRPLGSVIFGVIGDNYGRAISVKVGALVAAVSTGLIGLIPSFKEIGIWAPIMLIFCRLLFLVSLAGDSDAVKIYITEKIGPANRNFGSGIASFCSQTGALIAAISYHYTVDIDDFPGFWRINFIIGGMAGLLVMLMRHYFQESQEFLLCRAAKKSSASVPLKFFQIISQHQRQFLAALLINGCIGGVYHFLVIFLSIFASKILGIITINQAHTSNIKLIAIYSVTSILSGFVADRVSPARQSIAALILSISCLSIVTLLSPPQILITHLPMILMILAPFYIVPCQIMTQILFAVDIRTRMYSLAHSVGSIIFSGTTPFLCMLLWKYSGSIIAVFGLLAALLLILLGSIIYLSSQFAAAPAGHY